MSNAKAFLSSSWLWVEGMWLLPGNCRLVVQILGSAPACWCLGWMGATGKAKTDTLRGQERHRGWTSSVTQERNFPHPSLSTR